MIIIDPIKKKAIDDAKRKNELLKLLSDSDWTQVSDVIERKGQEFVDQWKVKRNNWWNELRGLES